MYTISNNIVLENIVNKSKFIACLYYVETKKDVERCLEETKEKYANANHYCYGYIIDNYIKTSDDKEPSGTAGIPILNVLQKNDLNYICCIVVRYFGGIKLGATGLLRAYSNTVSYAINQTNKIPLANIYYAKIEFEYEKIGIIKNILNNSIIMEINYHDNVEYTIKIEESIYKEEITKLQSICTNINILKIKKEKNIKI